MKVVNVDVFVVGAGPTGLTCAALLAKQGANVTAISRYPGLANSPRAHIINQRTMEVFRDLGLEDRVIAAAMPAELMGQVVWMESFAGREIARRRGWGAGADRLSDYARASPSALSNIHQHILEPILCEAAREFGAMVTFDTELIAMRQDGDRVVSLCRNRASGEEFEVNSRYAVGADGDNSTVCREIGFEVEGETGLGHMLNFWIEADLTTYVAHRPGALYQVLRAGGHGQVDNAVFVNVRPWSEWVMSVPFDPAVGPPDRSIEAAEKRARAYVGDDALAVRLISTSTWTINQVHAEVMHRGRVVIAGNAAHRHPPASGLGANTCIQDAFNVAWKLGLIVSGAAHESLLATYTEERAPVARQVVQRANESLAALFAIPAALGLRPGQTAEEGESTMRTRFDDSAVGSARRAELAEAVRLQDYNFNALGVEMGQRYTSVAIATDVVLPATRRDPALFSEPSTAAGSPLPHVWLTRESRELSSLDLVGRGRFTILTGIGGEAWREAAATVAKELAVPLEVVTIGPGQDAEDAYGDWAGVREIAEDGCLLVRPDRHIAFRAMREPDGPTTVLLGAVALALGRPVPTRELA